MEEGTMSVKHGLLAILAERPTHGYGLKSRFEKSTAGLWPLNIGQVYTTLARLERDGLVASEGVDARDRQAWKITKTGRSVLADWFQSPVNDDTARNELAIKVLIALTDRGIDVGRILQTQRAAAMKRLQEYTAEKRRLPPELHLSRLLLLDALTLKVDAEIKWIDLCEQRLRSAKSGAHQK
jgi:DNA-binding PadR family transcriptional regulator